MREILFRGKRKDTGEWVTGFYSNELYANKHYISQWYYGSYAELQRFEVIPETVGQFTGKLDYNGKRIFEGDLIKCSIHYDAGSQREIQLVGYMGAMFLPFNWTDSGIYEVIGNMHDNPELLNTRGKI